MVSFQQHVNMNPYSGTELITKTYSQTAHKDTIIVKIGGKLELKVYKSITCSLFKFVTRNKLQFTVNVVEFSMKDMVIY